MKKKYPLGFTLIELLVVIAILGVLAGAVLVAINPLEQLAKGRDAGRKTTVNQLGRAVESYYTSQNGEYPTVGDLWMSEGTPGGLTGLQAAGELKRIPPGITPACGNVGAEQNGYCFENNGTDAIVYVPGESASEKTRAGCGSDDVVWIVWSSVAGKTGSTCTSALDDYPTYNSSLK